MSSFNINGPTSQPMVQSSQNLGKDGGGGGNTGYMNMRKRKKGEKDKEEDNSVFLEEEMGEDTFEREGSKKKEKKENKFLGKLADIVKRKQDKKSQDSDSFTKSEKKEEDKEEEDNEQEETENQSDSIEAYEEEEDISAYKQIPVNKIQADSDDEYEVIDDDYYDDIDV